MVYEKLLRNLPLPSLRLYGFIEERDCYWLFMEEALGEEYCTANEEHRSLAGHWLGTVHQRITENVAALPDRGPNYYRALLDQSRDILRQHLPYPLLSAQDVEVLHTIIAQFDVIESHWNEIERISAAFTPTLVHGDFVRKNVRVQTSDRALRLLVFDWENAGFGLPAADLTQFTGSTVSPELAAYASANPAVFKKGVSLARIAAWGRVFRLLESIRWTTTKMCFKPNDRLINPMACLRIYTGQIADALAELEWRSP
jgi:hypothetical protein